MLCGHLYKRVQCMSIMDKCLLVINSSVSTRKHSRGYVAAALTLYRKLVRWGGSWGATKKHLQKNPYDISRCLYAHNSEYAESKWRRCGDCGKLKLKADFRKRADGQYRVPCLDCERVRSKIRYHAGGNKVDRSAYFKAYRQKPDVKVRNRKRLQAFANTPEGIAAKKKYRHARRARMRGAICEPISARLFDESIKRVTCYWCGCRINRADAHRDHVFPLAGGGGNIAANLAWSCPHCNLSKGHKHPNEWSGQLVLL